MVLTIDIGNSNIVLGCCDENKIYFAERLSTDHASTSLQYAILFKNIIELNDIELTSIEGGIISSVVPSITSTVKQAVERITGTDVLIVGPGIKTGLSIMLDNPAQLGADQVVDAVAGISEYKAPMIIIDMGTASTISVIDENKHYIGGMILPGLRVSLDSLIGRTSQLPKISLDPPKKLIGSNTIDCMKSGILHGTASCIDGMIGRIEKEMGREMTVIATGGLAEVIIPYCERDIILDNELLLKGLMITYLKNR